MALILIRDLKGKGNYDTAKGRRTPLTKAQGPGGRESWHRTGGDALMLDLGKAADLVFRTWEAVVCKSGRAQEDAILRHVQATWGDDGPIVRLDPSGQERPEVWQEFCDRHPEIMPTADPGTMEYMQQTIELAEEYGAMASGVGIRRAVGALKIKDIENASQSDVDAMIAATGPGDSAGRAAGGDMERSVREGAADQKEQTSRMSKYADAVFSERYAEHRASGKSESQSKAWAERSREKAMRDGADA